MKNEEKAQIIAIIKSEIIKLSQKVTDLKEFCDPIAPDDAIGRVTRMDAINNKSVFDASMRNTSGQVRPAPPDFADYRR